DALALGKVERCRPTLLDIVAGEVDEVVPGVAVLGQRRVLAERLPDAGLERLGQGLKLVAGVVDVELGRDRVALTLEQARQRVADRGGAGAHDHERTGRVRPAELEPPVPTPSRLPAPVPRARG